MAITTNTNTLQAWSEIKNKLKENCPDFFSASKVYLAKKDKELMALKEKGAYNILLKKYVVTT